MDCNKKIELFGKIILQDLMESDDGLKLYKCVYDSTLNLKNKYNSTVCTLLLNDNENLDVHNDHSDAFIPNEISEIANFDLLSEYTEDNFYFEFHMRKSTFSILLNTIKMNYLIKIYEDTNFSLPIEKSILITLWYLAKGVSFHDISEKYDIIPSFILPLINSILTIFANMQNKFIIWPNRKQSEINSISFANIHGYPNVVGAMGQIHINFKPPLTNDELYRNKNMGYSLILHGICNQNKEFINIFPGYPGSIDCTSILKHSVLYKAIEETSSSRFFYNHYHVVASESYPLRSWIMTPFRFKQVYSAEHQKHNDSLLSTLFTIENAFALLQGRWRILHFVNTNSTEYVTKIMEACCVLHNFCIKFDDLFDDMLSNKDEQLGTNEDYFDFTKEGELKRNKNLNSFH